MCHSVFLNSILFLLFSSLTLLLFKLVLRQENWPHQLPDRRLNGDEELPGVGAERGRQHRWERETHPGGNIKHGIAFRHWSLRCRERKLRSGKKLTRAESLQPAWSHRNRCPSRRWLSRQQAAALTERNSNNNKTSEVAQTQTHRSALASLTTTLAWLC